MTNNNIDRTLGRIEGQLFLVLEEQKRVSVERRQIFKQLENIEQAQIRTRDQRENQAERLKIIEQNIADFNKWRERARGAIMLISCIGALIGGTLATSWHKIIDAFK